MIFTNKARIPFLLTLLLAFALGTADQIMAAETKADEVSAGLTTKIQELDKKLQQFEQRVQGLEKSAKEAKDAEKTTLTEMLSVQKNIETNSKASWYGTLLILCLILLFVLTEVFALRFQRNLLEKVTNEIRDLVALVRETRAKPGIFSVNPQTGPTTGGTEMKIEGENFDPRSRVSLRGRYAPETKVEASRKIIVAITPPGNEGEADVTVESPEGHSAVLHGKFKYQWPAPAITLISPDRGSAAVGEAVTISGVNFRKGAKVNFGQLPETNVVFVNENVLKTQTPTATVGEAVKLRVINPDGQEVVADQTFTFH